MWNKHKRTAGRISSLPALALFAAVLAWQPVPALAAAGKVSLDLTYVAAGIGYQTGTATVTVGGKTATFNVKGAQFLGVGVSTFHAEGDVNGAGSIESIGGDYSTVRGSITAIVGGVSLTLKSKSGVTMELTSTSSKGIDVSIGPGELTFTRVGGVKSAAGAMINPCAANPCAANPCAANPCAANPCAAAVTPIRPHAFDNFQQAAALGKKMWNNENLGTSGLACMSCHADYELLNLGKNQNYPHYVDMVGDVVSLDQMINFCMVNPMKGKQFEKNSKELTAMGAYFRAYRMRYIREHRNQ